MADTVNTAARAAQASSRTPMRRRGRLVCLICSIVLSLIRSGDIPAGGGSSTEPSSQPSSRSVIRTGTGIPPFHQQLLQLLPPPVQAHLHRGRRHGQGRADVGGGLAVVVMAQEDGPILG